MFEDSNRERCQLFCAFGENVLVRMFGGLGGERPEKKSIKTYVSVRGQQLIVDMNLNVNFNTPTIEKVIQKRWTIAEEIMTNLQDDMQA